MQILGFLSILLLLISAPTLAFFVSLFASLLISSRAILNAISPDNSSPLWPTIASHRLPLPGTARAEGATCVHATFQTALIPSLKTVRVWVAVFTSYHRSSSPQPRS